MSFGGVPIAGVLSIAAFLSAGAYWIVLQAAPSPEITTSVELSEVLATSSSIHRSPLEHEPADEARPRSDVPLPIPQTQGESTFTMVSTPAPSTDAVAPSKQDIKSAVSGLRVHLYSTSWCGYCRKARTFLETNKIPYTDHNVEEDPVARDRQRSLNPTGGVPVLEVEGEVITGFDEQAYGALIAAAVERTTGQRVRSNLLR